MNRSKQTVETLSTGPPANWQPGDDVIIPPPGSCGSAKEGLEKEEKGKYCLAWFMCLRKDQ